MSSEYDNCEAHCVQESINDYNNQLARTITHLGDTYVAVDDVLALLGHLVTLQATVMVHQPGSTKWVFATAVCDQFADTIARTLTGEAGGHLVNASVDIPADWLDNNSEDTA